MFGRIPTLRRILAGAALGLGAAALLASCDLGDEVVSPPAQPVVASFAADIQPILHPTCTTTSCHGGNFPQEGLDLRPPTAYNELVNRPSSQLPALLRVEPGDPDNSYFYRKLLPCSPPNCGGSRMPRDLPPLSSAQLDLIRNWIATGAQP